MKIIKTDLTDSIGATSTASGYDIDDTVDKKPWTSWTAGATPATITVDYSGIIGGLYIAGIDAATIRVYLKNGAAATKYDSGIISTPAAALWFDAITAADAVVQAVIVLTHATAASVSVIFGGAVLETTGDNGLAFDYKDSSIITDLYKPETAKSIVEGYTRNIIRFSTICGYDSDGFPELTAACRDGSPWPMPCKPWPKKNDYILFGFCKAPGTRESETLARCTFTIDEAV